MKCVTCIMKSTIEIADERTDKSDRLTDLTKLEFCEETNIYVPSEANNYTDLNQM